MLNHTPIYDGTAMLPASPVAFAGEEHDHALITKGDIAIVAFLSPGAGIKSFIRGSAGANICFNPP